VPKRSLKKRALVENDEDETGGAITTLEESVPTPLKPAPVSTPGKPGTAAKKVKTSDGKEVEPIKAIIKETVTP